MMCQWVQILGICVTHLEMSDAYGCGLIHLAVALAGCLQAAQLAKRMTVSAAQLVKSQRKKSDFSFIGSIVN